MSCACVIAVVICLSVFSGKISAQYRFDSFTTDNGLPQNGVREITQTPEGYLWFTTFDGLVRYDGAKFTVFDKNNSPGILSNRFFLLHVEPDGTLFAGTEDGGLTVYRNGVFRTYTTADGLPSNAFAFFKNDAKGEFIIGTSAGNCYFRDGKFIPVPESETPNNNLYYFSPTGHLWLYGKHGIRQITPDKREINYPIKLDYVNDRYSGIRLFEDSQGDVWLGDGSSVYCLKDGKITKYTAQDGVPPTLLRPFVEEDDGSIWFASSWYSYPKKFGLVRFYQGKFTAWGEEAGLSNLGISQLFKDREGTIWVSTDRGLNRLRKQFIKSYSTADGLPHAEVYPLLQTRRNGDVYIGTIEGLSRFRDGKFTDVMIRNDVNNFLAVSSLHEDPKGQIWIGDAIGLYRLENEKLRKIDALRNITVWAISSDRAGNLWVGTAGGLFELKDEKLVARFTVKDGLPSDDVKVIHEDSANNLWIGTYGGLVRMAGCASRMADCQMTTFTAGNGLASDRVRTIYEDDSGTLWIGTYDGGLSRFKDGKFFNYTIENGLFNNGVFQILTDDKDNFWISSNRGIYRVKKQELEDLAEGRISKINSIAYGKPDGMSNTECNGGRQPAGIKAADGNFWFPTQDGVVVFNPNEASFNPQPPPVRIESVLIERQATDFQDGIELKANEDNLEIRYTGISFIKSEQVNFRYRIEGLEENWTDVRLIRDVYFPSLPSGEYTFHVIAANSDGVWNEEGARLKIKVNAPFWRKTWFIVLSAIATIAIIFLIFRLRERELKRRHLVQQEFARRLIESQEQERKRIASELHDSLGQYLLAIKNWALFGLNSVAKENPAREYLGEVSETTTLALEEVREMTHNLRPYQLERLGLTNTLEYMLKNIKNSSPIRFSCQIENVDGVLSKDAEIVFYRVVQETINNVIKHSEAAKVWLSIKQSDEGLEFICRDDGKGFDIETAKNSSASGLGLNGIAERVKILKGIYEINSEIGKFTTVFVKVPKNL